jgi:uncharacterized protein YjbJ (UPF0337 family)
MFKNQQYKDFMGKVKQTTGNLLNRFKIMPVQPNIKDLIQQAQDVSKQAVSKFYQK